MNRLDTIGLLFVRVLTEGAIGVLGEEARPGAEIKFGWSALLAIGQYHPPDLIKLLLTRQVFVLV